MSRYKVLRELGKGGMGVVYAAHDAVLEREVALKLLHGVSAADGEALRRFKREVSICQQLRHPHVVRIFDAGELRGAPFFTMELVDAQTLESVIADGALEPRRAVAIACQLLDALAYCHENALVHRDLKPANVMLRAGDDVVLMDFGLAKVADGTLLTAEGNALGTPRYMAPEVVRGEAGDARADVWAAGVVLYEMLAGHRPFTGNTIPRLIESIQRDVPAPIAGVPASLMQLVLALLAKDPARRIATAREAAERLGEWRDDDASAAFIAEPGNLAELASVAPASQGAPVAATAGARAWQVGVGAAVAVCLLGAAWLARGSRAPAVVASASATAAPAPPAAITSLHLSVGATVAAAEFDGETGRAYRVQAGGRSVESAAGKQVRRVVLEGLEPGTEYTLQVLSEGAVVREERFTTGAAREAGTRLLARLDQLEPYALERELTDRLLDDGLKRTAARARHEAVIDSARRRVADAERTVDLGAAAADFAALKDRLYAGRELSGAEKRRIYARVEELIALEDALRRGGVELPWLGDRLASKRYGMVERMGGPCDGALVLTDEAEPRRFETEGAPGPHVVLMPPLQQEKFKASADLRDPNQKHSLIGRFTRTDEEFAGPLAVPAGRLPGNYELRAAVENTFPAGLRFYTRPAQGGTWKLLAVLRSPRAERTVVAHAVPGDALEASFQLRIEVGYSVLASLDHNLRNQEVRLKWLVIGRVD